MRLIALVPCRVCRQWDPLPPELAGKYSYPRI